MKYGIELGWQEFEADSEEDAIEKFRAFLRIIIELPIEGVHNIKESHSGLRDYLSVWMMEDD